MLMAITTVSIVAYRPVVKQRLGKQWPLIGNARNIHARDNRRAVFLCVVRATIVVMQRSSKHTSKTTETPCFLRGPCRGVILKTIGATVPLQNIRPTVTM
jgi:hypothetical protein